MAVADTAGSVAPDPGFLCMADGWKMMAAGWAVMAAVLAGACRPVSDAWMTGWTEAQANDRIMLVRAEPRTLGYQRLESQSGVYPDLAVFLRVHGMPDFLAESTTSNRHFLILYYLDRRIAFACPARAPSTRLIEFNGPYPITEREFQVLDDLKRQGQAS